MRCRNCGCENLDGTERCKKCEFPLNKKIVDRKYLLLYLFLFIYSFVIPFLIYRLSLEEITNSVLFIAGIIHFFAEVFAIITTKSLIHKTDKFSKVIYNYDLFCVIVYSLFIPIFSYIGWYNLTLILSVLKVISYFIAKRFVLKDKILLSKWKYVVLSSYIMIIFILVNVIYPTNINKYLFLKFGNTDLSSKELHIILVDKYSDNKRSYFKALTSQELKKINDLDIDVQIDDSDLKKMNNVQTLTLNNYKGNIDFTNDNLEEININNSNISSLKLKNNIKKLYIYKSKINELKISDMKYLNRMYISNAEIKDLKLINNKNLYEVDIDAKINNALLENNTIFKSYKIKTVDNLTYKDMGSFSDFINSNKYNIKFKKINFDEIEISLNNEQYIEFDHSFLHVSSSSLVKDLNIKNISYKIVDYYDNEVVNLDEKLDGKYLQLYENDNLIKKISF